MKIGFIASQFPETHETFILREFSELSRLDVDFMVYSLKPCLDEVVHLEVKPMLDKVRVVPWFRLEAVLAHLSLLKSDFGKYFSVLAETFRLVFASPRYGLRTLVAFPAAVYLAKRMKEDNITHIHSHWATTPTTVGLLVSKFLNTTLSFTAHAWDIYSGDGILAKKIRHAEFVATCTGANAEYLRAVAGPHHSSKIKKNYHGLSLENFVPEKREAKKGALKIITIGRMVETKGYPILLEALEIAKKNGVDFHCTIVGEGELFESVKEKSVLCSVDDVIDFVGTITLEEVRQLLCDSDIMVMPCVIAENGDRDGIPNVFVEASAMKVPVVSTNVSGIPELVELGVTGFLVPTRNAQAVADVLEEVFKDKSKLIPLGEGARARVEELFDVRKNVLELAEMFKNVGEQA